MVSSPTLQHVVCKLQPLPCTSIFFPIRLVCLIVRGKVVASGPCRFGRTGGQVLKWFPCIDLQSDVAFCILVRLLEHKHLKVSSAICDQGISNFKANLVVFYQQYLNVLSSQINYSSVMIFSDSIILQQD